MSQEKLKSIQQMFLTRLDTLSHILEISKKHFQDKSDTILAYSIIDDMLPFGTQIIFTCNQPHNFTRWCEDKSMKNLSPNVESLVTVENIIEDTKTNLMNVNLNDDKLVEITRLDLTEAQYLELTGIEYIEEFLIPNFYFHLVTVYNIMRLKGVPLGKADYLPHLVPKIKNS